MSRVKVVFVGQLPFNEIAGMSAEEQEKVFQPMNLLQQRLSKYFSTQRLSSYATFDDSYLEPLPTIEFDMKNPDVAAMIFETLFGLSTFGRIWRDSSKGVKIPGGADPDVRTFEIDLHAIRHRPQLLEALACDL